MRKWKVSTVIERQISRRTLFLEIYKSRILWKLKEEKCVKTLWYQLSILCLGRRGMGEHHRTCGGYFRNGMIGLISCFLGRAMWRISLLIRTRYTHQVDEKEKSFDRRVQRQISRWTLFWEMYSRRISWKLKEVKCIKPLWYEFNVLCLGSRGMGNTTAPMAATPST